MFVTGKLDCLTVYLMCNTYAELALSRQCIGT